MATLSLMVSLWLASVRSQLQYRANFLILIAMGLIYHGTGFAFIWVVLTRFESVGGWTLGEIAFLYGLRLLIHAIGFLVSGQIRYLDEQIRRAQFDRYLIRPLSPLRQIISQGVQVNVFGDLLGGIGLFLVALTMVDVNWTAAAVVYLLLAIIGGALLELGLDLMIATLALRVLNVQSLFFVLDTFFSDFGNYPLKIFGGMVQFLLTFGLPLAFMAYFPSAVLLGKTGELNVPPIIALIAPLVGACWFTLAVYVFRSELRNYQSAGH